MSSITRKMQQDHHLSESLTILMDQVMKLSFKEIYSIIGVIHVESCV